MHSAQPTLSIAGCASFINPSFTSSALPTTFKSANKPTYSTFQ